MPEYDLANPEFHPDHGPVVVGDRPCIACGYNLTGLPVSGVCPECGKSVEYSLRGELLQYAAPEYVKRVDTGLRLILAAIITYVVLIFLKIALAITLINFSSALGVTGAGVDLLAQGLTLLPSILFIFGYWMYTTPDPGFTGREKPTSARTVARIAACVQPGAKLGVLVMQLLGAVAPSFGSLGLDLLNLVAGLFHLLDLAAYATLFFAITLYTRWVAFRIPDPPVIKQTRTDIWLLPVLSTVGIALCGLGPVIALILYYNMLAALRRRTEQTLRFQQLAAAAVPPLPKLNAL